MWGQANIRQAKHKFVRIIPTRVGTRQTDKPFSAGWWDHPHACGDKQCKDVKGIRELGSSPRVWGQVPYFVADSKLHRIIPTRVGTRSVLDSVVQDVEDHPHACGDKLPI